MDRPILRYHGGKFLLAEWIISYFPPHRSYVECFGGAGSVLMQKQRTDSEVYNDKWDLVVNVFRVLRDTKLAGKLMQQLELTPFSRTEFLSCNYEEMSAIEDPVELARRTILRSFAGFGSASTNEKYATGFRANNRSKGTNCAKNWRNYPAYIPQFIERLRGVVIENKDYREVIKQQDSADTLFFLDPPYVHETRNMQRGKVAYEHEFTDQDHIDMVKVCNDLKGKAMICGYDCTLYQAILKSWHMAKRSAFADGAKERTECLWMNYPPENLLFR